MSDRSDPDNRTIIDECGCSGRGCCGSTPPRDAINRRQFMQTTAAAGGLGLLASGPAASVEEQDAAQERWNASLMDRGSRRWYAGAELEHIEMPMGGIGAGQVYLGGRGAIGPWQIVNNFNSMAYVPGGMFGVWTRNKRGAVARVLEQKTDESVLPSIASVEFAGEYPFAWIRYHDQDLPVEISLESYCPLIPLDAKDSALPAVIFRFTVKNTSSERIEAAIMASMPNLIGWNGYTEVRDHTHAGYIGNVNETLPDAAALRFTTVTGAQASMNKPCSLVTNALHVADAMQLCERLIVAMHGSIADGVSSNPNVYWLTNIHDKDLQTGLKSVLDAVEQGASLIVGAGDRDLLSVLGGGEKSFAEQLANRWRDALPIAWKTLESVNDSVELGAVSPLSETLTAMAVRWRGVALKPKKGAETLLAAHDGTPIIVQRAFGKGRIAIVLGTFTESSNPSANKHLIANLVAHMAKTSYTPQQGWPADAPFYGSMVLAAMNEHENASLRPQWNDLQALWKDFSAAGRFDDDPSARPSEPGTTWNGAISVPISLEPGEERQVTFVLTWHFPNRMRDFRYGLGPQRPQYDYRLGNQYNNWFADASDVFRYVAENFDRLDGGTRHFHDTFYDSTLPQWLLDAVTANLSIVRSPIIMWIEDGTVAGFEGTDACCPMNCTHVYNYAMSMAFMFPELERNVREVDLLRQMNPDEHFIPHRTLLPLELPRLGNTIAGPLHHALDGELGTILKTYREWRLCGDNAWMQSLWGNLKLVLRHVLDDHDVNGDGVLKGEQPNTYDIHTYGSNTFVGSLYLAALRATEEMARHFQDEDFAKECRARFDSGSAGYDAQCWQGSYYRHLYDSPEANPAIYEAENSWGPGCHADQLLGQWWAHIAGLGYVLPQDHVKAALSAIHKNNWRHDFHDHQHNQRVFAEGDEKGLLCCTWPEGGRPEKPVKYCDEVWTGIEYHVAASLIREGLAHEGLQIARGARDRYTGDRRNPWSELECGGHYARAMAAHSLLLAAAGIVVDLVTRSLKCVPALTQDNFKAFFSTGKCWGTLIQKRENGKQTNQIQVRRGMLELERLEIEAAGEPRVQLEGPGNPRLRTRNFDAGKCMLVFEGPITLNAGESLTVRLS